MPPSHFRSALVRILLAAAPLALHADFVFVVPEGGVHSGQSVTLQAFHSHAKRANWRWSLVEADGGTLTPGPGDTAVYQAPRTLVPRQVQVRVFDEADPRNVRIRKIQVHPGLEAELMRLVWGKDWMTPRVTLLAGDPEGKRQGEPTTFTFIAGLHLVQDKAMPQADGRLAVGDRQGIRLVSSDGEISELVSAWGGNGQGEPPGPIWNYSFIFECSGLAVRPRDSRPENPHHIVYGEVRSGALGGGSRYTQRVMAILPDGTTREVAGGPGLFQDGPKGEAMHGRLGGLEMSPAGDIYVLDTGNRQVRRISPAGEVTTLAGRHWTLNDSMAQDGPANLATFEYLQGIARDPATGDLYVSDRHAIRRITPAGDVSTLLGRLEDRFATGGFALPSEDPDAPVPAGFPCLNWPGALLVEGRNLYISDVGNRALRVFDLDYRTLHTLCGGPDAGSELRLGPLAYYAESKRQEGKAVIPSCHGLAFGPTGTLVAADMNALVQLEAMPRFVSPARSAAEDQGVIPESKDR